ncbi:MAG: hypothetical protein LBV29_09380 [Azoarcus sp.]|jgi:hypothetical protein|nr:hypothetical protein [Azoarcus sp.]
MKRCPSLSVILDGGIVHQIVVQDWPADLPLPQAVVVDYDDGIDERDLQLVTVGADEFRAWCYPVAVDSFEKNPTDTVSPAAVLFDADNQQEQDFPDPLDAIGQYDE